jgi:hypothetical protein
MNYHTALQDLALATGAIPTRADCFGVDWPSILARVEASFAEALAEDPEGYRASRLTRLREQVARLAKRPEVGEGVTIRGWSDSHPGTIIRVSPNNKRIWFRMDSATLINGADSGEPDALRFSPGGFVGHMSGTQRWHIEPNPEGAEVSATLRQDGSWCLVGGDTRVTVGERWKHYDFNF